jgi:hypothetical protein
VTNNTLTERLRISSAGSVGIGTSPSAGNTLDISSGDGTVRVTQELDVATAGLNLIGASNQGTLGRITIWQNATSAQGGYIKFDTCPTGTNTLTERMKIDSDGVAHFNGDVKVLSGDIQMGSGRGINFSPNSHASGMTSETLDDYEEGLWTLTITTSGTGESVSIGNTTGTYTKIGRQVTATIYTSGVNVSAAGSGALYLGGLPFTAGNGNEFYAVPSFGHTTLFSYQPDGYVAVNTNYIAVTRVGTTTPNDLAVGNPKHMMMTVTYFTA